MDTTAVTTSPGDGGRKSRRRKGIIGLLSIVVAALMMVGAGFAFFSDSITGNGGGTAGTLDLTGNLALSHTNGESPDTFVTTGITTDGSGNQSVANINPGDVVKLDGTLTNAGNKSAWIRTNITPGATAAGADIAGNLYVYSGESVPSQADLMAASQSANPGSALQNLDGYQGTVASLTSSGYNSATQVINGTGANAETEAAASLPTGVTLTGTTGQYSANVEVYFDSNSPNADQNQSYSLNVKVQALQYRNNNSAIPTDTQWASVKSGTLTGATTSPTWSGN